MLATYLKGSESVGNPITLIGLQSGLVNTTTTDVPFSAFSADMAPDDLVVVYFATSVNSNQNLIATGYTEIGERYDDAFFTAYDTNLLVAYKFMGETPDTSIILSGKTSASFGGAFVLQVWRNVNKSQPLDVASVNGGSNVSGAINPLPITPVTPGAYIIAGGARGSNQLPTCSSPDLSGFIYTNSYGSTSSILVAMGYKEWGSGTFDPGAFSFSTANSTSFSLATFTIALRPA